MAAWFWKAKAGNKNGEIVKSADLLTKEDLVYSGTYEPRFNASFTNLE